MKKIGEMNKSVGYFLNSDGDVFVWSLAHRSYQYLGTEAEIRADFSTTYKGLLY